MKKILLSALTLMSLVACGGGGGGGGGVASTTTSTVGVSGVASKGLLGKATVNVYAVTGGVKGALLGTTTTDATTGEYSVTGLTANTNPIIVEVVTTANTTFCDETKPLVGGKFDCTGSAGAGTVIRSTLPDLSKTSITHVTPFSEMAVAAAESTGSFTAASLATGQNLVSESLGFNPMTVKPVNADATMDTNQEKMMTLLSAVMLDAKLNTCSGDASGMKCMIVRLNEGAKLTKNSTDGTYTAPSIAAAVNTPKDNFKKWVDPTNTANLTKADGSTLIAASAARTSVAPPTNTFMTAATTKAASITAATPAAVDPVKATTSQGLENFITVMRDGVNSAKDTLDTRLKAAEIRTDALIGKGTSQSFDLIDLVTKNCDVASNVLTCSNVTTGAYAQRINYVKVNDQKYCYYSTLVENGVNYTVSGNFEATLNESTGAASGTLSGTTTTVFSGNPCSSTNANTKMSELNMVLSGTGLKDGSTSGKVSIDTLTFKAYDQAANSSKWAQMALSGISMSATVGAAPNKLATATLTAPLAITSSDGDKVSGTISANIQDLCKDGASPCAKSSYPTKIDVSFSGILKEGAIASFNMVVTQAVVGHGQTGGYKPWVSNSASNPINGTATMTMTFVDNVSMTLTETFTGWNSSNLGVNFTSNGNTLYLTAKGKNKTVGTNEQVLDGDITVTSSGVYSAKMREGSDKKAVGEVFQGTEQIGNLVSGVLYMRKADGSNGQIISLK